MVVATAILVFMEVARQLTVYKYTDMHTGCTHQLSLAWQGQLASTDGMSILWIAQVGWLGRRTGHGKLQR